MRVALDWNRIATQERANPLGESQQRACSIRPEALRKEKKC